MSKREIIDLVNNSGCNMLKDSLYGGETKDDIIAHLRSCRCPVIKKYL